jgi:hypothetical protein
LESNGECGYWTTSPLAKLSIDGSARVTSGSGYEWGSGSTKIYGDSVSDYLRLYVGGADRLTVLGSGKVGIGTTTPGDSLDVYGIMRVSSALSGFMYIGQDGGGTYLEQSGNDASDENIRIQSSRSGDRADYSIFNIDPSNGFSFMGTGSGNGNVGIGTSNPGDKLEIRGGNIVVGANQPGIGLVAQLGFANGSSNQYIKSGIAAVTDTTLNRQGLYFFTSVDGYTGTEKMRIDSNGNVGIGMTAPEARLDLLGNSNSIPVLKLGSNSTHGWNFYDSSTDGDLDIYREVSDIQSHVMTWKRNSGNVGIGTTSPNTKLSVNGTTKLGNGAWPTATVANSGQRVGMFSDTEDGYLGMGNMQAGVSADRGATIYLGARMTTDADDLAYASIFGGKTNSTSGNNSSYLSFKTSGGNERMRIDGIGNVGIGTTSPITNLSVYGVATHTGIDVNADTGYSPSIQLSRNAASQWYVQAMNAGYTRYHSTNPHYFSGGNVGIGTSSPINDLHVESATGLTVKNSTNGALEMIPGGSINLLKIYGTNRFSISGDSNIANVGNGSAGNEFLTVSMTTGNVGIGTTTPNAKLQVVDSSVNGAIWAGSINYQLRLGNTGTLGIINNSWNSAGGVTPLSFQLGESEKMRIDTTGNIGIGTTSPTAKLSINDGRVLSSGSSYTNSGFVIEDRAAGGGDWRLLHFSGGSFSLNYSGDASTYSKFLVDTSGNVGIGTTTPNDKLVSAGNFLTSGGAIKWIADSASYNPSVWQDTNASGQLWYVGPGAGSGYRGNWNFDENGNVRMVIAKGGNIGIGTTSPSAKLSISQGVGGTGNLFQIASSSNGTATTTHFVVGQYGNVGIGTTTLPHMLNVAGNIGLSTGGAIYGDTSNPYIFLNHYGGAYLGYVDSSFKAGSGHLTFMTGGVQQGMINSSGFGIGTTSPSAKLDVWGNLNIATGTTPALFVNTANGNVGIGTSSPDAALDVIGTIQSSSLLGGATNVTTDANGNIIRDPSDVRLKENVLDIESPLEKVLALHGVTYEWKDKERFGEQTELGFIAQEVDSVLPEIVRKGGDYWSLNTRNIAAVLVEAFKELYTRMVGIDERVTELETENEALRTRLEAVEAELNIPVTPVSDPVNGDGEEGDTPLPEELPPTGDAVPEEPLVIDESVPEESIIETVPEPAPEEEPAPAPIE